MSGARDSFKATRKQKHVKILYSENLRITRFRCFIALHMLFNFIFCELYVKIVFAWNIYNKRATCPFCCFRLTFFTGRQRHANFLCAPHLLTIIQKYVALQISAELGGTAHLEHPEPALFSDYTLTLFVFVKCIHAWVYVSFSQKCLDLQIFFILRELNGK